MNMYLIGLMGRSDFEKGAGCHSDVVEDALPSNPATLATSCPHGIQKAELAITLCLLAISQP